MKSDDNRLTKLYIVGSLVSLAHPPLASAYNGLGSDHCEPPEQLIFTNTGVIYTCSS